MNVSSLSTIPVARHPAVFAAIDPRYGVSFLLSNGMVGFKVLGGVFLCVTGAEALYADVGHFGARPIRIAWWALVLPCLVLNYAGQAALVISGASTADNIFYRLCPSLLLVPLVLLATIATMIASQSIIPGAFSMTRQPIQVGWLPRLPVTQSSAGGYGQIYLGLVNWLLMLITIGLKVGFGKSDNLASAYGIAVSLTMLLKTVLLFLAMREIFGWSIVLAGVVAGSLAIVDLASVGSNLLKIADGGYVPIVLAAVVYGVMVVWHVGAAAMAKRLHEQLLPIGVFMDNITEQGIPRVPGTAVFLTRTSRLRAACVDVARQAQQGPARAGVHSDCHADGSVCLRRSPLDDRIGRAWVMAGCREFRVHGTTGCSGCPASGAGTRLRHRRFGRDLFRRP
jgi:KUP system potassium uptake protein